MLSFIKAKLDRNTYVPTQSDWYNTILCQNEVKTHNQPEKEKKVPKWLNRSFNKTPNKWNQINNWHPSTLSLNVDLHGQVSSSPSLARHAKYYSHQLKMAAAPLVWFICILSRADDWLAVTGLHYCVWLRCNIPWV